MEQVGVVGGAAAANGVVMSMIMIGRYEPHSCEKANHCKACCKQPMPISQYKCKLRCLK